MYDNAAAQSRQLAQILKLLARANPECFALIFKQCIMNILYSGSVLMLGVGSCNSLNVYTV